MRLLCMVTVIAIGWLATETAAQADPDRYRYLIVRVAGYCSYFVDESPRVHEQIIARTLHGGI